MKKEKSNSIIVKIIKIFLGVVGALILIVALLFGYLTITEFNPENTEVVEIDSKSNSVPGVGDTVKIMTWNIGYGALGDNADFFMDGGSSVKTADEDRVNENMSGIKSVISNQNPDVIFLQETDLNSDRSHNIDELQIIKDIDIFSESDTSFAYNYKVKYVPYPIPPIGKVEGGIATVSNYKVDSATRIQLPCPFS